MKIKKLHLITGIFLISLNMIQAQDAEVFQEKGKTLIFSTSDPDFSEEVKKGLVETYFKVFPSMAKDFNPQVRDTIYVEIDTAYSGVAYAHNGKITISSDWLYKKPNDLDVITHEVMHIVQSYPPNSGPGWLTEGIADYVRFKYGVDNEGAGWSLPEYSTEQSYRNSYRITARFLAWLSKNYNGGIVELLDKNMRKNTYTESIWKENTGKNLDELWDAYGENPNNI